MCGLLGFIAADGSADQYVNAVETALPCMHHRGPDDSGTWHDDNVVFGFNRLSIIDIDHSHQPLQWGPEGEDKRYTLTFNGEIYNYLELREELQAEGYTFNTEGDGEPIVVGFHHWGPDVVHHLRGMFAFAVWDSAEQSLFIARDQFGIKPMFVATTSAGTAFGSEKKCILSMADAIGLSEELDIRAIAHYTDLQYVPEPETLHRGIRRLESGSYGIITPGGALQETRWFEPTFPVRPVASGSETQVFKKIAEALEDSVEKHMRADVTVGSFLSGGIDSTAIATLAKRHNPNLLTFTTGFEREGYSEIDVAAESAAAIGVEHIVKVVSPEEFAAAIPQIIWYLDDPVADPALVPLHFVAAEARKHVKVVLSGEGADELFGGYTIYKEPLSLAPFDKVPSPLKKVLAKVGDAMPEGVRGKSLLQRGTMSMEDRYYGNARSFNYQQLERVLREIRPEWDHREVTAPIYAKSTSMDPVARMQHLDLFTWMRGDILVKADKINMANSLELRVPFLDKVVFEVAETLPHELKVSHGTTKYALRKAMEFIVPEHVLNRKKLGFPVPLRHWLAGDELYGWAKENIEASQTDHIFNKAEVLAMLDEHRTAMNSGSGPDHSRRIWTVLCFMIWHGIFVEHRITPDIDQRDYPVRL
ncbi:asparagine synthase (glutamine-hydrolyzing) [Corynebacterium sp. 320]|uniref:asparagine synthase (glutamine-hydrolyzing) n=1 Tax=Corynebacterium TaxID=1716 RepID=UPI00125CCE1C|nr:MULTISPECIES: asparagine synthase (glutamine-hydrolyzing) [Corynebacterium]KAB1502473.1 asparagine synthase (glutamine-hydrolyzing) [Corynebacterium sp. 320]KAB1551306.1 asparagine synthase (glutamine-hydrolyzing) [Corynebacterium sp. 321]KAB1551866.1 asparagine synthase (glutamine-hydrolyzing) [Corynebacterium sp. 319]KAB3526080.1 asparagine synthase (glutamine-hydrolyzing) [Corynebacterium sp. 250]KAB3538860.1 asparagine synthase (glutamine-hydrolyzing) [Corynebacterium sp. 366]